MLDKLPCKKLLIHVSKALHLEIRTITHIFSQKVFRSHDKQISEHRLKHEEYFGIITEE